MSLIPAVPALASSNLHASTGTRPGLRLTRTCPSAGWSRASSSRSAGSRRVMGGRAGRPMRSGGTSLSTNSSMRAQSTGPTCTRLSGSSPPSSTSRTTLPTCQGEGHGKRPAPCFQISKPDYADHKRLAKRVPDTHESESVSFSTFIFRSQALPGLDPRTRRLLSISHQCTQVLDGNDRMKRVNGQCTTFARILIV